MKNLGAKWLSEKKINWRVTDNWRVFRRETQSNRESMRPLWFFHLYILSSATTALSTLCQGRLYPHIYIYIYIYNFFFSFTFINQSMVTYIYIYIYVAIGGKTERLYFHPFKLISWKQACKDESIVSLFFSPYYNIYHALLLCIEHCKTEKSIHRLPISLSH